MKILMINSVCGIRSTGRICTDLADVLKEKGHQCAVAYGRGAVPDMYKDISYKISNQIMSSNANTSINIISVTKNHELNILTLHQLVCSEILHVINRKAYKVLC